MAKKKEEVEADAREYKAPRPRFTKRLARTIWKAMSKVQDGMDEKVDDTVKTR